jgi:hypothetical protein
LLLIASSSAKTLLLLSDPFTDIRVGLPIVVVFIVAVLEFFVGVAMLMPQISFTLKRTSGLLLFSSFLCFAGYKFCIGAESCGCAGALEIPPWIAAVVDLVAIFCLGFVLPPQSGRAKECSNENFGALAGVLIVVVSFVALNIPSSKQFLASLSGQEQVIVEGGELLKIRFPESEHVLVLRNVSDDAVRILGIESSCNCVEMAPGVKGVKIDPHGILEVSFKVLPGARKFVRQRIVFFLDSQQQFVGSEVTGKVEEF